MPPTPAALVVELYKAGGQNPQGSGNVVSSQVEAVAHLTKVSGSNSQDPAMKMAKYLEQVSGI